MSTDNKQFFPLNGQCNFPFTTRIIDCALEGKSCNCDTVEFHI